MRFLITGGAGFLGSHLCEHFLKQGHHVTCLDKFAKGNGFVKHLEGNPNFRIDKRDLLVSPWVNLPSDYDEFRSSDSPWYAGDLDFILHFASYPSPKDYTAKPIETLKADSFGTLEMLKLAGLKKAIFVLASTGHIDFEQDPTTERTLYNEGKRFGEALTMAIHRALGVETRIVRMFNSYGPGMRIDDGRVVPTFIAKALRNEKIEIYGGQQMISLTYVDDMVDGIEKIMLQSKSEPIELGSINRISVLDLAEKIKDLCGNGTEIEVIPKEMKEERMPKLRLASRMGWKPSIGLEEGLKKTIEDFRRRM
jgi:dTDP-glucose 4,6-dehydratase